MTDGVFRRPENRTIEVVDAFPCKVRPDTVSHLSHSYPSSLYVPLSISSLYCICYLCGPRWIDGCVCMQGMHDTGESASVQVELDAESELQVRDSILAKGLKVVGWYHR